MVVITCLMPSLRFSCDTWFATTLESPNVPRIGETVLLLERERAVTYRVQGVRWNFLPNRNGPECDIDVDRDPDLNPCTKCGKSHFRTLPVYKAVDFSLSEEIVGFECRACNHSLHGAEPPPPPDPKAKDWHY